MDVFDAMRSQRAHRTFTDDDVADDLIERVLDAAVHAPSAENSQPWVFVVVRDPQTRAAIGGITAQRWERAREHERGILPPSLFTAVDEGMTGGVAGAPVLIVVCGDRDRCVAAALPSSIYPAVQNLLLAAHALGLAGALTTLPTAGDDLARLLELPDRLVPMAVVPLGHPARPLGAPRRRAFRDTTFRDRYGSEW
jgi:nitroreductase